MKRPGYAGCSPGYGQPGTGVKPELLPTVNRRRHLSARTKSSTRATPVPKPRRSSARATMIGAESAADAGLVLAAGGRRHAGRDPHRGAGLVARAGKLLASRAQRLGITESPGATSARRSLL